jgi:glycogen debranching enzyme
MKHRIEKIERKPMPKGKNTRDKGVAGTAEGYARAIALLNDCSTDEGFLASPTARDNYRRIWTRDGVIMGLAALMDGHPDLVNTFRHTLLTMARHQGPHGEIPSNVDPWSGRVSFGGTAGRVDGNLWFVIGCGQYWRASGDEGFLKRMLPVIERVHFLLGAWEYNARGLLYVPQTGDWADEYIHHGYVLYDQLLYLRTLHEISDMHRDVHGSTDHRLQERSRRLRNLIRANYWFSDSNPSPGDVYHEVLYKKGRDSAPAREVRHWMSFFAPQGYGYRFDALANVLVSLLGVSDETQREAVDDYICGITPKELTLLPAFHPVVKPMEEEWSDLRMSFSYSFKNQPHEFQNGGLWPMVTAFYAADLAKRGRCEAARRYVQGIDAANALEMQGEEWSFPEYVHGTRLTAGGTRHQGWSAAAAVIGHQVLHGNPLLR